jgi:hypothetical protein
MKLKMRLMHAQNIAFVTLSEQDVRENIKNLFSFLMKKSGTSLRAKPRGVGGK